ncbi:MAG: hypothetical protein HN601_05585 [Candidatus Marinimicrobia bacterium]|jgi:hypothetical protein|nr:hypothetical protein [Candidatus Neomarinimicrobiota bacterium]
MSERRHSNSDGEYILSWKIVKHRYKFWCTYNETSGFVNVNCFGVDHPVKEGLVGNSSYKVVANVMANEILIEQKLI